MLEAMAVMTGGALALLFYLALGPVSVVAFIVGIAVLGGSVAWALVP